ncbi:MAG: TAXI family TRAP transporter solute-binding subunit [Alphaproteobacteria bacterium]|nr:TAXI family TRAP transporter solute-binding subunit [Alphaproteobacteria bacterium]
MILRRAAWVVGAMLALPLAALALLAVNLGPAEALSQRTFFQILTGSTGGTYFPVGQLIAGLVSHPPGVDRCENGADLCGPRGLIVTARTSDGAVANVLAVNAGRAESGLAQSDVVAQAVSGTGAFATIGKQTNLRVVADLFPEDVHLIVARKAKIASVADLKGKRVSLGAETSGTSVTVKAILEAYGISVWRIKAQHNAADTDAQLLQQGQIDAFFMVGGRPVALVSDLVARGVAKVVPIDGKGRDKLVKMVPALSADTIPANTYPGMPAIPTVKVQALWLVYAKEPNDLVYSITRALFAPGNRAALAAGHRAAAGIALSSAIQTLPAPLHPGAASFYRERGLLKR